MFFIELTMMSNNEKILLNLSFVVEISKRSNGGTLIEMNDGTIKIFKESYNSIRDRIASMANHRKS